VLAIYFIWFWRHGGQTLAMKTWRIRLVASDGRVPSFPRAVGRFLGYVYSQYLCERGSS
jgi:uncharacterized RDD family membrane protein YckC